MPRQPFLPRYRDAKVRFPSNGLAERPEMAALVAQCIGLWTQVEVQMALILSAIMKSDTPASVAIFLTIRNARVQREVMAAAAASVLSGQDLEAHSAISIVYQSLDGQRSDLAHGVFAVSDDIPDAILWMEPKEHTNFFVQWLANLLKPTEIDLEEIKKDLFIYRAKDIATLVAQMQELWNAAMKFALYLRNPGNSLAEAQFQQLCALPQIQQELSWLSAGQQNKP